MGKIQDNYVKYVESKSPKTGWFNSLLHAFLIGGAVCCLGQMVGDIIRSFYPMMDIQMIGTWSSIFIVALTIFLTAFGVFDRIGKVGGAGTFIPISGFANSIACCAIEYKKEGLEFGVGSKMFFVAGPVLVNGVAYSLLVGIIYFIIGLF